MGALTASGSLARVMGPIFVTYVYNAFGLYVTFGIIEILTIITLILNLVYYKKMVPFQLDNAGGQNRTNEVPASSSSYVSDMKMRQKDPDVD